MHRVTLGNTTNQPFPSTQILLENVRLHLIEDRPPVNVTSPGSVPIDLAIGCMRIRRDETGVVQLQPANVLSSNGGGDTTVITDRSGRDREVLALQLVMQQLKLDNEHLKWQLRLNEKSAENVV